MPKQRCLTAQAAGIKIQNNFNRKNPQIKMKYYSPNQIPLENTRSFACKGIFICPRCTPADRSIHVWGSSNVTIQISISVTTYDPASSSDKNKLANNILKFREFSFKGFKQGCSRCKIECAPLLKKKGFEYLEKTLFNFLDQVENGAKRQEYKSNVDNAKNMHMKRLCEACRLKRCVYQTRKKNKNKNRRRVETY